MHARNQKRGDSLALRIPKSFAAQASVREGCEIDLSNSRNQPVIRPLKRRTISLTTLLARIRPSNLHGAIDTGAPIGHERL